MRLTSHSAEGDRLIFRLENERLWTVQLEAIEGEAGRVIATSETRYQCAAPCNHAFNRSQERAKEIGTACPRCGSEAEPVRYMIDVLRPHGAPQCACENFTTTRGTTCKHGHAALYLFGKLMAARMAEPTTEGP